MPSNSRFLLTFLLSTLTIQFAHSTDHAALNKRLFTQIYKHNSWGSQESRSGSGSTIHQTAAIRAHLPRIIKEWNIHTILDAPCGDFNWMKELNLSGIDCYIGLDIVSQLIAKNAELYSSPNRFFFTIDIVNHPLPCVDLLICRDCIQHLTDHDVFKLLANIKRSNARYLLISNYPKSTENNDIDQIYSTARITYRNLLLAPFNFPKPLVAIDEGFDNKVLTLWRIKDLPDL
jgi:hypothetical protein